MVRAKSKVTEVLLLRGDWPRILLEKEPSFVFSLAFAFALALAFPSAVLSSCSD